MGRPSYIVWEVRGARWEVRGGRWEVGGPRADWRGPLTDGRWRMGDDRWPMTEVRYAPRDGVSAARLNRSEDFTAGARMRELRRRWIRAAVLRDGRRRA